LEKEEELSDRNQQLDQRHGLTHTIQINIQERKKQSKGIPVMGKKENRRTFRPCGFDQKIEGKVRSFLQGGKILDKKKKNDSCHEV